MSTGLPAATAYHRRPIRFLNGVLRACNSIGLAQVKMDEQTLLRSAKKQTGLKDFGDESFLVPMRILLKSLEEEAELNPAGRFLTKQSIVRILKHRLLLEDLLKREPQILARNIAPPVVVVGLARSGTTRLHRLLSADDRFAHLLAWESVNPVPYPESFTAAVDPRITNIEQGLKAVLYLSPQIAAVHPLGAHEVEEEVGLIQHGFSTQIFEVCGKVPTFAEWLMNHDQTAAYEYMVTLMKVISWFRKEPEDKPWVLKSPQHMQDLDSLLNVFPEAKFIFPHRDPIKVMGSTCSMVWNALVRDTDTVDPHWVGSEWLDKTERMLNKTLAVRDQAIPRVNQYDVLYADITADWQQAVRGIYNFLGIELTESVLVAMQEWLDSNNQHKHGAHKYSLEDFGLSGKEIEQRLSFYRERFSIPHETHNPHIKS
jgi:hypothetical protein